MQQHTEPGQAALPDRIAASALLVREANHRVKNSLQLAISLLQARAIRLGPAEMQTRGALADTCDCLMVLSRVHELLYREAQLGEAIDFGSLLRELTGNLAASFTALGQSVRCAVEADHLCLHPDTAIPVALIATEAVSNAFKHAFPAMREGTIQVRLKVMPSRASLLVADNGVGIPSNIQSGNIQSGNIQSGDIQSGNIRSGSFGMQMIRALAEQIGGNSRVCRRNGTVVGVMIPLRHPAAA